LWAVFKYEDTEPFFISQVTFALSILLDIIVMSIYAGRILDDRCVNCDTDRFCIAINIIGILIKPWTMYVCMREFTVRGGDYHAYMPTVSQDRSGYQSMGGEEAGAPNGQQQAPGMPPPQYGQQQKQQQQQQGHHGQANIDAVPF